MARLPPHVLWLALAAGLVSPAAEENPAPLAESQQQLRQLQKDQKGGAASERSLDLKTSLPGLTTPALVTDAPAPPPPRLNVDAAAAEKAAPPDNWLLAGYDRLQRDEKAGGRTEPDSKRLRTDERPAATGSGGTRSPDNQSGRPTGQSAAQKAASRRELQATDPFAPFLKNWLAGSPVAQPVWESLRSANPESAGRDWTSGEPAAPAPSELDRLAVPQTDPAGQLASAKTSGRLQDNPFLAGLDPLSDPATGGSAPATNSALAALPASSKPSDATNLAPDKKATLTPPPDPLKDDRKYFPQLKRF